jgi:phenylacetate-CoA ligase
MTPDLALVQLIDPATGAIKEISEGAEGEYIFTHLDRQACPLLRYRTGDILRVFTAPCACGRIGFRMDIIGRSDDMLIVRGLNLFPAAIQSLVGEFMPATTGKMQIVLRAPGPKVDPPLHVRVECNEGIEPSKSGSTRDAIEKRIRGDLNVTSAIELVPFGTFERTSTKTRLVIIDPSAKEPVS